MILLLMIMLIDDAIIFEIEGRNDLEMIAHEIEMLRIAPIDINSADLDKLVRIPYLSVSDCLEIIAFRNHHGEFSNIKQLLDVPGIDHILFERIAPYVSVKEKKMVFIRHHSRLRWQRLFPAIKYSDHCYAKHDFLANPYRIFFISEKDHDERSFVDYYGAGVLVEDRTRRFAIGRFDLDLGKGLILSQSGSILYGRELNLQVRERGVIPYTSAVENGGFFGAALHDSLLVNFTIFYSNQKIDARIDSSGYARSFFEGDHVDSLSRSYKDRLKEEIIGYDVNYHYDPCRIANRTYWCQYDPPFVSDDSLRGFYGNGFWISSFDFDYYGRAYMIFGEIARVHQNRIGGIFGLVNRFEIFDFSAAVQYFPRGFFSPKGIESKNGYLGGTFEISSRNKVCNFNSDLKFEKNAESDSMLYRFDLALERKLSFIIARLQMNWRYASHFDRAGSAIFIRIKPSSCFFLDLRLEDKYVFEVDSVFRGLAGCIEMGMENKSGRLRLRYGIFDTDNFQSRLNIYEIDLPGVINNRMLFTVGDYGFIYLTGKLTECLALSGKYSIIRREHDIKHKIGMQFDLRIKAGD